MREIDDAGDAEDDRESGSDEKQRAGAREPRNELNKIEAQGRAPPPERSIWEAETAASGRLPASDQFCGR